MDQEEGRGSTIWWLEMCNNYSEKFAFWVSETFVESLQVSGFFMRNFSNIPLLFFVV